MLAKKIETIRSYDKGIGSGAGAFFWSQGLDIETTPPFIRTAPALHQEATSGSITDLSSCKWGVIFNNVNYTVNKTDGKFFIYTAGAWSLADHQNTQTNGGLGLFGDDDYMYYASNSYAGRFNKTTWTDTWQAFLTSNDGNLVPITKFQKFICFGNQRYLAVWDIGASTWTNNRVILPTGYKIKWLKATSSYLAISAHHDSYGSVIFLWDGVSLTYNEAIRIPNLTSLTGEVHNGTVYVLTSDGWVSALSSEGLSPIVRFPDMETGDTISVDPGAMVSFGGLIHIGKISSGTYLEKRSNSAGIWVFNPFSRALYFKYYLSGKSMTNVLSVGCLFPSPDLSTLRICWGITGANYIDASKSGGSLIPYSYGMILITNPFENEPYRRKRFSQVIANFYKPLPSGSNTRVIIKYNTSQEQQKGVVNATSGTSNSFTVNTVLSYMEVGDEIQVLEGGGVSQVRHVASISGTTITVDEALSDSASFANTSNILWTPYKKIADISGADYPDITKKMARFNARADKLQLKIELRASAGFTGQWDMGLAELSVVYTPDRIIK